jgi:HK97 family phage major capsid protein
MARTIEDIKRENGAIIAKQREILDRAEREKRSLMPAEEKEYQALENDWAGNEEEMRYLERNPAVQDFLRSSNRPPCKPVGGKIKIPTKEEQAAIRAALKKGTRDMKDHPEQYVYNPEGSETRDVFNRYCAYGPHGISEAEFRALQADKDTSGGYLVAPQSLANEIISGLDNALYIRSRSRTFRLESAESLGAPALDDDFGSPTWTAELRSGSEDNTMSLDKRQLFPHPVARRIKVSNKLLRMSTLAPETFIKERMIAVMSIVQENAFMTGSGANQPLGLFTASAHGINTDRDFACASQTVVKIDDLIGAVGALKPQYRRNASWVISRDLETALQKLKDGEGNYLLKKDLAQGIQQSLLGFPVLVSEYAPATFTTGKYVALLGDLNYYWICDALDMQIQRLTELYAETNQTGFIIRSECDAQPVLSSAFVRLKLA